MKFKKAVVSTFFRQIFSMGVGFYSISTVSNMVGSYEFGVYSLALTLVVLVSAFFSSTLPSVVIHYFGKFSTGSDGAGELVGSGLVLLALSLVIPFGVGWGLCYFDLMWIFRPLEQGAGVVFLIYAVTSINAFLGGFLLGCRRYDSYNSIQILSPVAFLIFVLAFVKKGGGWVDVANAYSFSLFFSFPFYLLALRDLNLWRNLKLGGEGLRAYFDYGMKLWGANFVTTSFYRIPYMYIESVAGTRALGAFSLAMQFLEKVWIPGRALASIIFPERSLANEVDLKNVFRQGLRFCFWNMGLVVLGVGVVYFAFYFYSETFFGSEYHEATDIVFALSLGVVAWGGVVVLGAELAGRGQSGRNLVASIVALVTCYLGMSLGKDWGVVGISYGVSFGYLSGFLASLIFFLRLSSVRRG